MIENVHDSLPKSTLIALEGLLIKYQDVFSKSELDLGMTNLVKHRIYTNNAPPVRQPLRPGADPVFVGGGDGECGSTSLYGGQGA